MRGWILYRVELVDKFFEGRLIDNLKVVGVNALYQKLDAETLAAQMPYLPVVLLVDTLHYQFHQQRAFEY